MCFDGGLWYFAKTKTMPHHKISHNNIPRPGPYPTGPNLAYLYFNSWYLLISRQQDRNIVSGSIRHLDTTLCILSSCHNASLLQPITAPPSWQLYNRNGVLASPALENQSGPHIACTISTELQIVHCPCKLQQNINFDINECFSIQLTFSFDVHSFQSTVHCFSKYSFFIWKVIWISTFKCASTHYYT